LLTIYYFSNLLK